MLRNRSLVLGRAISATISKGKRSRSTLVERLEDRRLLAAAPTDITLSALTLAENTPLDTAVGTFASVDADAGDTFAYSFAGGAGSEDNLLFTIQGNALHTNAAIDFETRPSFNVRIRSTSAPDGLWFEKSFVITTTDVAEAPSDITLNNATVAENAPAGAVIGAFSTTDQDTYNVDNFVYSLVAGAGDTNNGLFEIVGGELRSKGTLDFETVESASIRVRSTDSSLPTGQFFEKAFNITITNIDEVEFVLTNNRLPENSPADALVGFFQSTSSRNFVSYAFGTGAGDTDNALFSLTAAGELHAVAPFDYDLPQNTYSIRVDATDDHLPTARVESRVFTIQILNLNEAPSQITFAPVMFGTSSIAGTFATVDEDLGDTFTYSLVAGAGDADNALFAINQANLEIVGSLPAGRDSFNIRVRSADFRGAYIEQTFTVLAKIDIGLSNSTVVENSPIGTVVGGIQATGATTGVTLTYDLFEDVATPFPDNASFAIVNGQLVTSVVPNYESAKTSYSIQIRTTAGTQTYLKAFTINVGNDADLPTDMALSNSTVPENAAAGAVVGTLSTTHADLDDAITYALVAGVGDTDNASFAIVNGQLVTTASFDFETKSAYSVRVEATDSTGNKYSEAFAITVTDVAEFTPTDISLIPSSVAENAFINTIVGSFGTTDADPIDSFTYTLVAGTGSTDNARFTINAAGQLRTAQQFNLEAMTGNTFSIRVRTTDSAGLFFEKEFAVAVTNVNEAPDVALLSLVLNENVPVGTVIGTTLTDPDAGDVLTLALVENATFPDNQYFEIVNNQLQTKSAISHETKSTYMIRLQVSDAGGLNTTKTFVLQVADQNDAPVIAGLTNTTLQPGTPEGRFIAEVRVTEEDEGDSFITGLVDGPGGEDNALFDLDYLQLRTKVDLPTDRTTFSILIGVTDSKGLSTSRQFTLSVVGGVAILPQVVADESQQAATDVVPATDDGVEPIETQLVATVATPATINGTEDDDVIVVAKVGTQYVYTINGAVSTAAVADVSSITINALGGDDIVTILPGVIGVSIFGGAGDDSIAGGEGNDFIQGGDGNDSILGADGVDTVYGNLGNDILLGGSKRDEIYGGLGDDNISGNEGPDMIYAGNGADYVRGALGADYIEGRGKADTIIGGEGNDTIIGGAGADSIMGSGGDDVLYASASELFGDYIDGGDGFDLFEADIDDTVLNVESPVVL